MTKNDEPVRLKTEEIFTGRRYEVIAWARREKIVFYGEYPSSDPRSLVFTWVLVTKSENKYLFFTGTWQPACIEYTHSGPKAVRVEDSIDFLVESGRPITRAMAEKWAGAYQPQRVISAGIVDGFIWDDKSWFDEFKDEDKRFCFSDFYVAVKLAEGVELTWGDVEYVRDLELRAKALEKYGLVRYIRERAKIIDTDGENLLCTTGETEAGALGRLSPPLRTFLWSFVLVKDSSSGRHYMLRVPPTMETVRESIAWTFGMEKDEYQPEIET